MSDRYPGPGGGGGMTDDLFRIIRQSIAELDAAHQPESFAVAGPRGGCVTCWPQESGWPCVSRMVADDLRAVLGEGEDDDQ